MQLKKNLSIVFLSIYLAYLVLWEHLSIYLAYLVNESSYLSYLVLWEQLSIYLAYLVLWEQLSIYLAYLVLWEQLHFPCTIPRISLCSSFSGKHLQQNKGVPQKQQNIDLQKKSLSQTVFFGQIEILLKCYIHAKLSQNV